MLSKLEVEARSARSIAQAMAQTFDRLEGYWPKSKRGSNAQRELDNLKDARAAIELCLNDGLAETQNAAPPP